MRKIYAIISKIKWLGLLGIPTLFSNWYIWKLLWLFWLFGIVEILMTLPVFLQSLHQIVGIIVADMKNKPMPDKDNFIPQIKYSLPFQGVWTVVNGGVTKEFSHSWEITSQRYAYDFIILNNEGKSHFSDATTLSNYFYYGKKIFAPADGVVVEVRKDCGDSIIMGGGKTDPFIKDIRGNYIVIKHADKEYSCLAHLMPDSITVSVGEHVKRKQQIALCGNSGNTSEPHLHFQIQNGKNFFFSAGLPIHFEQITVVPQEYYNEYDPRPVPTDTYGASFISRGQCVSNY